MHFTSSALATMRTRWDVMHFKTEGQATFDALLYIPKNPPFDYYTKEFEKGLALYSNGV